MNEDNFDRDFLGQGLAFPLQINARGELALSKGDIDIEQAIHIILSTAPGERVMRPEFGCRVHELIFEPFNAATIGLINEYVRDALGRWEPRIEVKEINIQQDPVKDGAINVEINYEIRSNHNERSIIYPFFLTEEE